MVQWIKRLPLPPSKKKKKSKIRIPNRPVTLVVYDSQLSPGCSPHLTMFLCHLGHGCRQLALVTMGPTPSTIHMREARHKIELPGKFFPFIFSITMVSASCTRTLIKSKGCTYSTSQQMWQNRIASILHKRGPYQGLIFIRIGHLYITEIKIDVLTGNSKRHSVKMIHHCFGERCPSNSEKIKVLSK